MTFQDLLKKVEGVKAETLPALLPELFRGIYEGGLSDTEREALFLSLKKKTGVSMGALRRDWGRYLATREAQAREEEAALPEDALEAARELSQDPALLHRAIRAMGALGVVGEEENRGLLYLALLSARTERPIIPFYANAFVLGHQWNRVCRLRVSGSWARTRHRSATTSIISSRS
jgi:hypothetical protein